MLFRQSFYSTRFTTNTMLLDSLSCTTSGIPKLWFQRHSTLPQGSGPFVVHDVLNTTRPEKSTPNSIQQESGYREALQELTQVSQSNCDQIDYLSTSEFVHVHIKEFSGILRDIKSLQKNRRPHGQTLTWLLLQKPLRCDTS